MLGRTWRQALPLYSSKGDEWPQHVVQWTTSRSVSPCALKGCKFTCTPPGTAIAALLEGSVRIGPVHRLLRLLEVSRPCWAYAA